MQTTVSRSYSHPLQQTRTRTNLWKRFINWSDSQQNKRLEWLAVSITGHGCIFTILTSVAVLFTGNHFIFWPFVIGAMASSLIVNLAAMPTKITIPVLFFSLLIDVAVIIACLANGFDTSLVYR